MSEPEESITRSNFHLLRYNTPMVDQPTKTLRDLVEHLGRYPEDAFLFVRDGLSYTAERLHGPETEIHRKLQQYLSAHDMDWADLSEQLEAGTLPKPLIKAIE